jgi:hypothetical protein
MFKIEVDEDGYQLVVDEEESGVTDYGEIAQVNAGGDTYCVLLDVEDKPEEAKIYRMVGGAPVLVTESHEVDEVNFEIEDDEEDDEDGDEEAEDDDEPAA